MAVTRFGLDTGTIEKLQLLFKAYPSIEKVLIYGSRAKNTYHAGSDIDLCIIGTLSTSDLLSLENQIDDLLLPYKMDLSLYSHIENQELRDHIDRVGLEF